MAGFCRASRPEKKAVFVRVRLRLKKSLPKMNKNNFQGTNREGGRQRWLKKTGRY
jgi:hypothetical protein